MHARIGRPTAYEHDHADRRGFESLERYRFSPPTEPTKPHPILRLRQFITNPQCRAKAMVALVALLMKASTKLALENELIEPAAAFNNPSY
jgi:hypothetical protein